MEKGKHSIDVEKKIVTFGHETKTIDGSIILTTSFDFSKVDMKRLLKRAADAELIAWRAKSGIKGLTTVEAEKQLQNVTVDCSAIVEKVKHVETPEEKARKEKVNELLKSHSIEELIAMAEAHKAARAAEDAAQADMEDGESHE